MTKTNLYIVTLTIFNSTYHLIAMQGLNPMQLSRAREQYQQTIKRLNEQAAASEGHSEEPSHRVPKPFDPKVKSEAEVVQAADPITQAVHKKLVEAQAKKKFDTFLVDFQNQVSENYLFSSCETRQKIIDEHIKKLPFDEFIKGVSRFEGGEHSAAYSPEVQKKIDAHYKERYITLYKEVYRKHFDTEAPARVAEYYALQAYEKQTSCCGQCCVIL